MYQPDCYGHPVGHQKLYYCSWLSTAFRIPQPRDVCPTYLDYGGNTKEIRNRITVVIGRRPGLIQKHQEGEESALPLLKE